MILSWMNQFINGVYRGRMKTIRVEGWAFAFGGYWLKRRQGAISALRTVQQ
jgi:hypothetical protein